MLLGDMSNEVEIKGASKMRTVHDKKFLTSVDVIENNLISERVDVIENNLISERAELQEFLGSFYLGISLHSFERIYEQQKLKRLLDSSGVSTLEDPFEKMPGVAILIKDRKTNLKRLMSARVIEDR